MKKNSPELVRAVHAKDVQAVRSLIARGADPESTSKDGTPVLLSAVAMLPEAGMPIFEALVAAGARVDQRGRLGRLPLEVATSTGNEPAVRRLLELGADPHADTRGRVDILNSAVSRGHTGVIKALLPRFSPPFDPTLLCLAAGFWHPDAVTVLLEAGAAVDAVTTYGDSALHAALKCYDRDELTPEPIAITIVETLLAAGADPKRRDADGNDALALARKLGYPSVLKLIEEFTS